MAQFLSGHNLDYVYNQIRINVKTKINYNLDDNSQYKNILIPKLSSAVHNKYRNYDITALNEIAISATTDHIIKIKKKKQSQTTTSQPEVQQNVTTSSLYNTINPESFSRTNLNLLDIEDSTTNGYLLESNTSLLDNSISNHELNNNTILDESFPFKNQVNNSDVKELDNSNSEALNETRFSFENVIKKEDNDFFKKLLKNNDDLMVDSQQNQLPKPLKDKDYDSKSDPNLFKLGLTEQTIRNNIKDQSNANLMEGYNPNRPILPETHLDLTKTTLDSTLNLHSEGSTERKPYMVILDVLPKDTSTSNSSLLKNFTKGDKFNNISCTLINTFRTGFKYDIYLEFVALHDIIGPNDLNIENYHSFILKISELKSLNTLSNNNEFIDSLIIPNDTYGTSNLESGISDGIKAFSQILPATTFTHDADTTASDKINYDSSTKILTFKTTFATGTSLALIAGDKLSFTYAGTLTDGTYSGTVATDVTITSNTNSQSITFTDGLILEGTTTALLDSAVNDTFKFLGKFGNIQSASAKLTSTVVKLKSNYICSTDASTFRDFTITLKGMKSSNLSSDILEANGSTTRLQIGLFFKPN
jgi:hypothetical protein